MDKFDEEIALAMIGMGVSRSLQATTALLKLLLQPPPGELVRLSIIALRSTADLMEKADPNDLDIERGKQTLDEAIKFHSVDVDR